MQELSAQKQNDAECVKLMTLHAAKGLEFDTVILNGLDEGIFPSARSSYEHAALEEERRLFYVGLTRARERILVTHARYRYTYGQMTDYVPSRFLDELPNQYIQQEDISSLNSYQIQQYMQTWLGIRSSSSDILTFGTAQRVAPEKKRSQKTTKSASSSTWKKNQMVKHKTFGIGYIKSVSATGNTPHLTIQFTDGVKKLKADFVEKL
jgi:DNA helicase-2/ATP-dependent DNA helicase PcrA